MNIGSANGVQLLFSRQRGSAVPEVTLQRLGLSLKKQWKRYRKELKRCQKKFSEKAVHQSRVETRRLLSIVELLDPFMPDGRLEKIRACLKRHLDTFDDLRDTHVQLLNVRELRKTYPAAELFHRHLRKAEERYERRTRKNIKRIRTKRLGKLITACRNDTSVWQATGMPDQINSMLVQALDAAFRRTAQLKAAIDPADTETIHRTRVAFKRFRYMMELMAEFLPNGAPELMTAMHAYQILMGDVQDIEVLRLGFEKFARKAAITAGARNEFRKELERRKRDLIARYIVRADELDCFWHNPARSRTNGEGVAMPHAAMNRPGAGRNHRARSLRKKTGS